MKDETGSVAIGELVELKPKIYSFLVYNNEHKKAKGVNKNVVATISYNEYKVVLLNKECIRHSMNRVQSKDHRIGIYEINKISLSCFHEKMYIQNDFVSWLPKLIRKNIYLNKYLKNILCQAYCFNFQFNWDSFFVKHNFFFNFQSMKILPDFWLDILNLKNARHLKKV